MKTKRIPLFATILIMLMVQGARAAAPDLGAIWFIGDSITQSNCDGDPEGSPRKSLYDLLTTEGYAFSYTGHHMRNVDGLPETGTTPAENLYHYHSGISGSVIGDNVRRRVGMTKNLTSFWESGRLTTMKPNLILIMLGTNDVEDMQEAPDRLKKLIESIYALPGLGKPVIFLATIPPNRRTAERYADDPAKVAAFNAEVPGIVAGFQKQGKDIHFVDQFTPLNKAFSSSMRPDRLHPNGIGNDTMARQWFEAIESVYSARPTK